MKIAICAICKNENLYLREWVEYHKSIGIDNIILYDNNEECGEFPHQVIFDYIMDGYVDIHNIRGNVYWATPYGESFQVNIYNKCLQDYKDKFDWIAFIDIDEFITLDTNNIHHTFDKYNYDKFDSILLSWLSYGDDSLFFNLKETNVQNRFQEEIPNNNQAHSGLDNTWVKSIVNTKTNKKINSAHGLYRPKCCCVWGEEVWLPDYIQYTVNLIPPIHKIMYIKHYPIKSFAEYLCRRIKTGVDYTLINDRIKDYKKLIGWTDKNQKMLDNLGNYISNPEKIDE